MPVIPANQLLVVEIISEGTLAAAGSGVKKVDNVYHFRRTTNVNPVSKANIESAFQTAIMLPVTDALNLRYTQVANHIRWVNDATDRPQTVARTVAGAITGDSMASYDAVVINLKTGYKGGVGRGSKHYAPLSESDATGDVLITQGLTNFGAIRTALLAGFTDSDGNVWVLVILSRKAGLSQLTVNPTTVFTNDVITAVLDKTTGTMRRRKTKTVV